MNPMSTPSTAPKALIDALLVGADIGMGGAHATKMLADEVRRLRSVIVTAHAAAVGCEQSAAVLALELERR
jgi:hypothetical protein